MLEMCDEHQTGLPFECLVTRICMQVVLDIPAMEPKEKTKDTFGKHTVIKSNAQLRIEDQQEVASPPAQDDLATASSSNTAPPPLATDAMLSRILDTITFYGRSPLWVFVLSRLISTSDAASKNWIMRMMMRMTR
jgi:hypothetical protein